MVNPHRVLLAVLGVLALAAAPAKPPPPPRDAGPPSIGFDADRRFAIDADCVVTDFTGCCGGCPSVSAMRPDALRKHQQICEVVDCSGPARPCPSHDDPAKYRAVCRANACEAILREHR